MVVCYFGTGMNMHALEPADDGPGFTFSRVLKPLERVRGELTFLSGTYLEHGGGHSGDYTFLTGVKAHQPGGIKNGISADQVAAAHLGRQTRFPSLQMSVRRGTGLGGSLSTLSWNRNGVPLAAESDPHVLFGRLFGAEGGAGGGRALRRRGSVLDAVADQGRQLRRRLGGPDRQKLDEYLASLREVEQQLQREAAWAGRPKPRPQTEGLGDFGRPYDPETTRDFRYHTYARLMYDLIALAFQTDSTRVVTYMVRREGTGGVYPEFGVAKDYHALSHHNNDAKNLDDLARVDVIYMTHWAYFLDRLRSIKEPDGTSLLDSTLAAFSSGMGIGHSKDRLPTVLCGGKALGVRHQGHLRLPARTPLASLWQTLLDRLGVPVREPFQDSRGVIRPLLA
jgi:hypothetical protein